MSPNELFKVVINSQAFYLYMDCNDIPAVLNRAIKHYVFSKGGEYPLRDTIHISIIKGKFIQ